METERISENPEGEEDKCNLIGLLAVKQRTKQWVIPSGTNSSAEIIGWKHHGNRKENLALRAPATVPRKGWKRGACS